jgi:hypothetical protein
MVELSEFDPGYTKGEHNQNEKDEADNSVANEHRNRPNHSTAPFEVHHERTIHGRTDGMTGRSAFGRQFHRG